MLTPADAALQVGAGEFHEFFLSCTQDGLAPGSQGWWDDNCMLRPWDSTLPTSLSRSCCCLAASVHDYLPR